MGCIFQVRERTVLWRCPLALPAAAPLPDRQIEKQAESLTPGKIHSRTMGLQRVTSREACVCVCVCARACVGLKGRGVPLLQNSPPDYANMVSWEWAEVRASIAWQPLTSPLGSGPGRNTAIVSADKDIAQDPIRGFIFRFLSLAHLEHFLSVWHRALTELS